MKPEYCVVEYCGRQRQGKTTLMVADLVYKALSPDYEFQFKPHEVYANFQINLPGVNCYSNDKMLEWLTWARRRNLEHVCLLLDECSQPPLFYARNSMDRLQTALVTSAWQMPKRQWLFLYSSNIGNSVDVQLRDATWLTIMPLEYHHGATRELDYIDFAVIHAYEVWTDNLIFTGCKDIQELFDSGKMVI